MSWLDDTENHRKRQIEQMAKALGMTTHISKKQKMVIRQASPRRKTKRLPISPICTKCVC